MRIIMVALLLAGCAGGVMDTSTPEGRCASARLGLAAATILVSDDPGDKEWATRLAKAGLLVELYCAATAPETTV